jgi:hypothetical protein
MLRMRRIFAWSIAFGIISTFTIVIPSSTASSSGRVSLRLFR